MNGSGAPRARRPAAFAVSLAALVVLGCPREPPRDAEGNVVTVGTYRIRTFPRGARVWVDGGLEVTSTPATLILEAGTYHLRLRHPGADEGVEETITVEAGRKKTLDLRIPAPPRSTLSVLSDVDGASVRVNGYRRGVTPLSPVTVKAGPVDVTVTAPDGRARSARTRLDWGEQEVLRVDFDDATDAGPSGVGYLTLVLAPAGWVEGGEGRSLGETPLRRVRMAAGTHRLRLHSADGSRMREVTLRIGPGEDAVYRFRLTEADVRE